MAERRLTPGTSLAASQNALRYMKLQRPQVVDSYRVRLRDGQSGAAGDEVARKRVEEFANKVRPPGFLVSGMKPPGTTFNLVLNIVYANDRILSKFILSISACPHLAYLGHARNPPCPRMPTLYVRNTSHICVKISDFLRIICIY